jgi:replicative DNA helicase
VALDRIGDFGSGEAGGGEFWPPSPQRRNTPPRTIFERIPPQNIEAEQAVLGAMLLGDRGAVERAAEMLGREDFYREAHGNIFEAMISLAEKDEPVDAVTLKDELVRRGVYDLIGGPSYLMALGDAVPTTANIGYYAKIVQEKAVLRRLIEAAAHISGLAYGDVDDVDTLVDQAERAIFAVSGKRITQYFFPLQPLLTEAFEKIDTLYHEKGVTTGIDTGFKEFNYMTSGLQDGDLIIIAARPSMGKTSLCLSIGQNAALRAGKSVAIFSLEMSKEQLVQRMICSEARVDAHRLRTGHLNEDDWGRIAEGVNKLWETSLFIDDSTDLSALEIRAKCRRLRAEHGLDLIIVDYLQLMRGHGRGNENRNQEITEIARGLKGLARDLNVPVIALSQLSRAVERREDKRPMLSDLRESGSIEAEADVVGFIYRPAYYERKEAVSEEADRQAEEQRRPGEYDGEEAEIIIAKQRNGPTGIIKLSFLPKFARFDNLAEHREEDRGGF